MHIVNRDTRSLRSTLLLGAASAAALTLSLPASAQDQATETVVVTGSRIPQQGLYAPSPVTAVGQQEMKFEGTTGVETLLNNLPSVFADQTVGRFERRDRHGNRQPARPGRDTHAGARQWHASDAGRSHHSGCGLESDSRISCRSRGSPDGWRVGRVRFGRHGRRRQLRDAQGFRRHRSRRSIRASIRPTTPTATIATSSRPPASRRPKEGIWDGANETGTLILGTNTANGKGNVTAYLGYQNTEAVFAAARDFSACTIGGTASHVCAGSSNYNRWISLDSASASTSAYDFFQTGTGAKGSGNFVPYTGAANQKFNYGALNYLQRPDQRYQGGFFAHYDVNKELDVYSSFMFTDDNTHCAGRAQRSLPRHRRAERRRRNELQQPAPLRQRTGFAV